MPTKIRIIIVTRMKPPSIVKSILVCSENNVKAKTTTAVIPTAISTSLFSNLTAKQPRKKLSAIVINPRIIIL